jgi:hypothetical protein
MDFGFEGGRRPPTLPKYHYHNFEAQALLTELVFISTLIPHGMTHGQ